jgi:hypothetical protein
LLVADDDPSCGDVHARSERRRRADALQFPIPKGVLDEGAVLRAEARVVEGDATVGALGESSSGVGLSRLANLVRERAGRREPLLGQSGRERLRLAS